MTPVFLKIILLCIVFLLIFPFFLHSRKAAALPDLAAPQSLKIDTPGQRIYITEKEKIFIYSLSDFSLVKRFGKIGQEPGQFNNGYRLARSIIDVDFQTDALLVNNRGQLVYFTKKGEFKKKIEVPYAIDFFLPVGDCFIGENLSSDEEQLKYRANLLLYNKELKMKKKLVTSHFDIYGPYFLYPGRFSDYELFRDCFRFRVFSDCIYLADTKKGFYIAVYDQKGNKIDEINKDFPKRPVSPALVKAAREKLEDTVVWKKYGIYMKTVVPQYLPAFEDFIVNDGKIYVFTFPGQDNQKELILMDLKGNILGKTFVPAADHYTAANDNYYYLYKNENNEWELHIITLNQNSSNKKANE